MVRKIKIEKRCKKKKMKQRRFTNKKLIALMLPLAVDQLLNSFMGTVDTLVVSNLGSAAISAVSLVDSINILVVQAFFALASGGTVVCSHYLGCEKKERATNAARQLVFITFAMSLVIAIACHLFSNQLLGVIFGQVEPAVMDNAKKYFFFSAMSYPFIALYDDGACILRAQENSKLPMQISFVANGINVALNLIFVWVLHLGVAGSSAATMIARAFAMVAVLYKLRNPKMKIQLRDYSSIRPEWEEIKRILHIGVPSGIENGMFQFGKLAIQSTVSLMGTAAIAAQGMTNIIENLNGIMSIDDSRWRMSWSRRKRRSSLLYKEDFHCSRSCIDRYMSFDVWAYLSDHIFWRHGTRECKTLYIHGNMYHNRKTNRVDHGIYSTIWIQGSRGC